MKSKLVLLVLSIQICLCAQEAAKESSKEVSSLLADYRKEFASVKESSDKVLHFEATKVAASLVGAGNADGAKLIQDQVDAKVAGERISNVDARLVKLFYLYDNAVVFAAKPVREKYSHRVDALLHSPLGKDMAAVVALGEAKKIIAGELPAVAATPAPKKQTPVYTPTPPIVTNLARDKKVLAAMVEGKSWGFSWGATGDDLMTFEKRGKLRWLRAGRPEVQLDVWEAGDEFITIGNKYCELRFDVGGSFGEIMFNSTKKRLQMTPSTQTVPKKK